MAAFMTVLESDLRALSAEARRRYPAIKDAAEHAILKVSLSLSLYFVSTFSVLPKFLHNVLILRWTCVELNFNLLKK